MNLKEVKHKFPKSASAIDALERLGFASRTVWLDQLAVEEAHWR
jgi:hypothetical protein